MKAPTTEAAPKRQWSVMLALMLAELTCALESNMLYSAISTLNKIFNDPVRVGWLITSFLLVSAAAAALCGRLGDLYGRSRVLMMVLAVAAAGSALSAFSSSLELIIAGRALQGVSMAILPLCFGLVRENWPIQHVPFGIGLLGATYTIGAGLGYILGGILTDFFSWHAIFYCSATFAVLAMLLVWRFVKPSMPNLLPGRLDIMGGVLFVPAIALTLYAITKAKAWGWTNPQTWTWLGAGLLLMAIWFWHEWRHKVPLINVRLLKNRQIAVGNLVFALASCGAFQLIMIVLLLLQQPLWTGVGGGLSATVAAAVVLPAVALGAGAITLAGHLTGRFGARPVLLFGIALTMLSMLAMAGFHQTVWHVVGLMLLAIPGQCIIYGTVPILIVEAAPPDRTSEATGLMQVVKSVCAAIAAQMIFLMLATSTVSTQAGGGGTFPTAGAYTFTLTVMSAVCVLALMAGLALPRRQALAARFA